MKTALPLARPSLQPLPWIKIGASRHKDGTVVITAPPVRRRCGGCTECCTTIPVGEIGKPENTPCEFLRTFTRDHGCSVYSGRPDSCKIWSCLWVLDDTIAEEARPDRCHAVFDMMGDELTAVFNATGKVHTFTVIQLWINPNYPLAYREPAVRAVMLDIFNKTGMPTLVRRAGNDVLVAPPSATESEWREKQCSPTDRKIAEAL